MRSTQNRKTRINKRQQGFTIVEFMIATAVFSLVLLICSYSVIQVGRMYYKGLITSRTQDAARNAVEDVTSAIQFGPRSDNNAQFVRVDTTPITSGGATIEAICVGDIKYSFTRNVAMGSGTGQSRHLLWKERNTDQPCEARNINTANPGGVAGQEMLGNHMRLPEFTIAPPNATNPLWVISMRVVYGETTDLFTDGSLNACIGAIAGGQFCAVSRFQTSVAKRL